MTRLVVFSFALIAALLLGQPGFSQDEPAAPDVEEDAEITQEMVENLLAAYEQWKAQQEALQSTAEDSEAFTPMFFIGKKYRYCAVCPDHATRTNSCKRCRTRGIGGEAGRVACGVQNPGCSIKFGECGRYPICTTGR